MVNITAVDAVKISNIGGGQAGSAVLNWLIGTHSFSQLIKVGEISWSTNQLQACKYWDLTLFDAKLFQCSH